LSKTIFSIKDFYRYLIKLTIVLANVIVKSIAVLGCI